jgi:hypothetical protein
MSGGIGRYSPDDLFAAGAVQVLAKPFTLTKVVDVLGQIVNETQAQVA